MLIGRVASLTERYHLAGVASERRRVESRHETWCVGRPRSAASNMCRGRRRIIRISSPISRVVIGLLHT